MHIPDGYLSTEVAAVTTVVAVPVVAYAARRAADSLDARRMRLFGVTAAFLFAVQMLNFPVAHGTSGHLLGAALAAVLLGPWLGCLAVTLVLAVQALGFADGGIAALGANVLNMAVLGSLLTGVAMARAGVAPVVERIGGGSGGRAAGGVRGAAGGGGMGRTLALTAGCAWLSVMAAALATALELALSGAAPLGEVTAAMVEAHAAIGVGEALISVAAVALALLEPAALLAAALTVSVALAVAVAPFASAQPDGLERVALDRGFAGSGRLHALQQESPVPDYAFPGIDDGRLATAAAGLAGTLAVFGLGLGAVAAGSAAARRRPRTA